MTFCVHMIGLCYTRSPHTTRVLSSGTIYWRLRCNNELPVSSIVLQPYFLAYSPLAPCEGSSKDGGVVRCSVRPCRRCFWGKQCGNVWSVIRNFKSFDSSHPIGQGTKVRVNLWRVDQCKATWTASGVGPLNMRIYGRMGKGWGRTL